MKRRMLSTLALSLLVATPTAFAGGTKGGGQMLEKDYKTRRDNFHDDFLAKGGASSIDFTLTDTVRDAETYARAMLPLTRGERLANARKGIAGREAPVKVQFISLAENARLPVAEQVNVNGVSKVCVSFPDRKQTRCLIEAWNALGAEQKNPLVIHEYNVIAQFEANEDYRISSQFGTMQEKVTEYRIVIPAPLPPILEGCKVALYDSAPAARTARLDNAAPLLRKKGYEVVSSLDDADIALSPGDIRFERVQVADKRFTVPHGPAGGLTLPGYNYVQTFQAIELTQMRSPISNSGMGRFSVVVGEFAFITGDEIALADLDSLNMRNLDVVRKWATTVTEDREIIARFERFGKFSPPTDNTVVEAIGDKLPTCEAFYGRMAK